LVSDTLSGVYKTTNASAANPSWTRVGGGLPSGSGVGRGDIAVTPANPNTLYVSFSTSAGGLLGLYKTTNGGTSWTNLYGPTDLTDYMSEPGSHQGNY